MTAPFAPPPHPVVWTITIGLIAVTVALPFARRDDWLGWLALCTIAGVSILLWAILIVGLLGRIVAWYRDRPRKGEGLDACVCYKDHIYQLTWDCDTFALQNFSGHRVLGVPRDRAFEVIDADAFFVEGEVTVDTPRVRFTFPASRSERAQLMTLIQELTRSSSFFHEELARRRERYLRLGLTWLPASLLIALGLVLPIAMLPEPKQVTALWLIAGLAYAAAWHWLLRRFAYAIAWLCAARRLGCILRAAN